jgi:DNA-binding transcriptional MerR regulator
VDDMKIGELAERTGVSVRSLRYYEEQELLAPSRTTGGQRVYDEDSVDRVTLVQHLFDAGLSSKEALKLLPCVYSGTTTPEMLASLRAERERIDVQARRLAETRDRLDTVIAEAVRRLEVPAEQAS